MKSYSNISPKIEIDLIDCFWKLFMQWKAILIFCIIMALLVPGAKYLNDCKEYKDALSKQKQAEKETLLPTDERITAILESLPANQREAVMFLVQQQEFIELQKDYLNNSIWLNTDPTNQRQLSINYLFKSDGTADMRTLADAYTAGLHNKEFLEDLRSVISSNSKLEYINELIDTNNTDIESGNADSAIYTITITLPEEVDADSVAVLIDSTINSLHSKLSSSVGIHSVDWSNTEDFHAYNEDVVNRRTTTTNTINTLNTSIDNAKSKLSAEQLVAYESIISIKQTALEIEKQNESSSSDSKSESISDVDDLQAPGFSKKYALLGFILGGFIYAGIYILTLVLKKEVSSASTAQRYTGARLLGELYKIGERKGLARLFASNTVARWRYKDKLDISRQISLLATTVDAVCSHCDKECFTLLLSSIDGGFDDIVDRITEKCKSVGNNKNVDILNADELDERSLSCTKNALYVISSKSKFEKLGKLMSLCAEYDVPILGTIYLEEL